MRKIKLIWDFRGPDALKIAEHHAIHLKEFATKEGLNFYDAAARSYLDLYAIAFIIVDEKDMIVFRDALKPNRGEVA
jgi:hypothetical protein